MCRLAAYSGPPVPLSALLYDPPHSLRVQAARPREQHDGAVNVDGTGVAWWVDGHEPLRYRSHLPPWSDPNLPALARRLEGSTIVASIRSASPGLPYGDAFAHPFLGEHLAFAHNGWIGAFRDRTARPLLERLPDDLFARVDGMSDTQVAFLLLVDALRRDPAGGLVAALAAALQTIADVCRDRGVAARLNLCVSDGASVVLSRTSVDEGCNSLYTLCDAGRWPGAAVAASEPLDADPAWTSVPAGSAVELCDGRVLTHELPPL